MGFSFLLLFFEVALIRFIPAHVQVVSYFINLVLISAFLGMGVGMILQARGRTTVIGFAPLLLVLIAAVQFFSNVWVQVPQAQGEYLWTTVVKPAKAVQTWGMEPVVFAVFILSTMVFVPLGSGIAREFDRFRPLIAYSINILGSLLGLAVFSLFSWLSMPPVVWFSFGSLYFAALCVDSRRALVSTLCLPVVLFLVYNLGHHEKNGGEIWSPYYKINYSVNEDHLDLSVNGSFHQHALNFSDKSVARSPYNRRAMQDFMAPYHFARSVDRVLVLGAGTGNDVAIALRQGAKHVDAVEIDREILRLGKQHHYQKPYADPRVTLYNDDARAFLKKSREKYDVIVLGTLDSQTLLSSMSSVRLDNYVYTRESFESIRDHLKPGGVLILYHLSGKFFIAEKIYTTLMEVFREQPLMRHIQPAHLFNFTFVAGWSDQIDDSFWDDPALPAFQKSFNVPIGPDGELIAKYHIPTDNWPYLYLQEPKVPGHYFSVGVFILVFSLALVWWGAGGTHVKRRPDWALLLLGAGFLLLETKSVTEMSLLFGSTWLVNVLVFSSILVMVLFANLMVIRNWLQNRNLQFGLLMATLLASYLTPVETLLALPLSLQWLVGSLLVALPIFFSSILFAMVFQTRHAAALALGYNVLGAVLGGLMEYNAMLLGTKPLYLLSMIMYLGAFYFLRKETARA
ncbi:methyltransferase domain-containing protein [Nitrospina gracilis]|uniref:spermine/spermidine synthase domain-containing protein n=1 Tax=Nitrospina gracilis TaxID=35801 RepID=UPI001F453D2B|nr:methyltransferase domain-containing protein [Nitrospina gracilis]MCF8721246.1 spermidine synthase/MFS family permease [Nitrospina gracilis Nb-211]